MEGRGNPPAESARETGHATFETVNASQQCHLSALPSFFLQRLGSALPLAMSVVNRRISRIGNTLQDRCGAAIAQWDSLEDPADIEDAVMEFLPKAEPLRSEAVDTLAKVCCPAHALYVTSDACAPPTRATSNLTSLCLARR